MCRTRISRRSSFESIWNFLPVVIREQVDAGLAEISTASGRHRCSHLGVQPRLRNHKSRGSATVKHITSTIQRDVDVNGVHEQGMDGLVQ